MLRSLKTGREKYGTRKYLARQYKNRVNKIFYRSDINDLVALFRDVGVKKGTTLCVHSSLSQLGYIEGGAEAIIDALQIAVGTEGTLLMPAFTMGGDMASQLESGATFDTRHTPASVGVIPETFRRSPDVLRSCHPTNSVAAWGPGAADILRQHDESITPFGHDTPYGRLASLEDSYILMLDTHIHSFLHHLQERVNFPNLFLPAEKTVKVIDAAGQTKLMTTMVMRPRTPYFVAIPSASATNPDWAILHDYALMFPKRRSLEARRLGYRFDGFDVLTARREKFIELGILKTKKLGRGELGLLTVRPFLNEIEPEFVSLIDRFRTHYDTEKIAALELPYS
jgi:aminoglycoside N3'-acetyltransferase